MRKFFLYSMIFLLTAALSACSLGSAPVPATSVIPPFSLESGSTATEPEPTVTASLTPYPTPTAAPSITPQDSPTPQPSITPMKAGANAVTPGTSGFGAFGCYNARLIKDVTIPDGMEMAPGQSFEKTWMFLNTGTCAWPGSTTMKFIRGDLMQAAFSTVGQLINPDKKSDATITFIAPTKEGSYKGFFQLADKNGNVFGQLVFVSIVVNRTAITDTPSPVPSATP